MNRSIGLCISAAALAVPAVVLAGIPASASSGSWSISDCRLDKSSSPPNLYATVSVTNKDPNNQHDYQVSVEFDKNGTRLGTGTTPINGVRALETGRESGDIVTNPSATADQMQEGPVDCKVTKVVDDNDEIVTPG
jgi:hypothetical protein